MSKSEKKKKDELLGLNKNISEENPDKNKEYFIIFEINFAGKALHSGSGHMRGLQLAKEFAKKYQYVFINPKLKADFKKYEKYLDLKTVLFKIKNSPTPGIENLKNPFCIWDVVDSLEQKVRQTKQIPTYNTCHHIKKMYNNYHLINCPNSKLVEYICPQNNPKNRIFDHIPHNWDDNFRDVTNQALNNEKFKKPIFVYIGTPNKKDPVDKKFSNYEDIMYLGQVAKKKDIGTFNVCASFRSEFNSINKPGTKCAVAASFNAVFIANKHEYGVYDLLGPDYPYYLEKTDEKHVKKMIKYIKKSYKTPIWDKAMECVRHAKEKSDIQNIAEKFIKHIENYFNNK